MGIRPPYDCLWCGKELRRFDETCDCLSRLRDRPRKLFGDLTVSEFAMGAYDRGGTAEISFKPRSDLRELADVATPTPPPRNPLIA